MDAEAVYILELIGYVASDVGSGMEVESTINEIGRAIQYSRTFVRCDVVNWVQGRMY
jgi:hypothetical protein